MVNVLWVNVFVNQVLRVPIVAKNCLAIVLDMAFATVVRVSVILALKVLIVLPKNFVPEKRHKVHKDVLVTVFVTTVPVFVLMVMQVQIVLLI